MKAYMVCLGLESGVAGWETQMSPRSYGGTPSVGKQICFDFEFPGQIQTKTRSSWACT